MNICVILILLDTVFREASISSDTGTGNETLVTSDRGMLRSIMTIIINILFDHPDVNQTAPKQITMATVPPGGDSSTVAETTNTRSTTTAKPGGTQSTTNKADSTTSKDDSTTSKDDGTTDYEAPTEAPEAVSGSASNQNGHLAYLLLLPAALLLLIE